MKTHGMRGHALYKTWVEMRYRCENPKKHNFQYYGGRGIKVCERWNDFPNFVADMGERPVGTTLDRIDLDGDYFPGNCRWASKKTQMNNMSSNRTLFVDGERLTMTQASERYGVKVGTIWKRLKDGWEVGDAVTRLPRPHKQYVRRTMSSNERAQGKIG